MASDTKRILTRDAILGVADLKTDHVEVPEWGGVVLVRGLTGAERDQFEADSLVGRGKRREVNLRNFRARLVARTVVDEQGNRLFTDADVEALARKSASAIARVYDVAARLSGLTDEDVDELVGNSGTGPSAGSGSDSR